MGPGLCRRRAAAAAIPVADRAVLLEATLVHRVGRRRGRRHRLRRPLLENGLSGAAVRLAGGRAEAAVSAQARPGRWPVAAPLSAATLGPAQRQLRVRDDIRTATISQSCLAITPAREPSRWSRWGAHQRT